MSNLITNWWRSQQLHTALKQGNTRLAEQLLQEIQNLGARLSWQALIFRDKLQSTQSLNQYKREVAILSGQLKQATQQIKHLEQLAFYQPENVILKPDSKFIDFISNSFNLIECDQHKLQCTGIDKRVFDKFEISLVDYLKSEINKIPSDKLRAALQEAHEDIDKLRSGQDPKYNLNLTPHVYFMKYFLDNIYGAYIAWFLIYSSALLPTSVNILDIAAGPGTVAYGLALLLESSSDFFPMPAMHISYYSLEQQALLQYRGLQFWRRYIEPQQNATNAYFRFDTCNFFDYCEQTKKLPEGFFDFIVISHCFFFESEQRIKSYKVFSEIFSNCLTKDGHVVLIIQGKKLFKAYSLYQSEDCHQEENVVKKFVEELGLNLKWYKYATSTGKRTSLGSEFARFIKENLSRKIYMSEFAKQYFGTRNEYYVLDDYIILAKK